MLDIEEDCIFGLDLMNIFDVRITNLPLLYPNDYRRDLEDKEEVIDQRTLEGVIRISDEEAKRLMGGNNDNLERNECIPICCGILGMG